MTIKRIDKMGRVCIPKEIREQLGMDIDSEVTITTRGNTVVIRKISGICAICGAPTDGDSINVCNCCRARIVKEVLSGKRE